MTFSRTGFLAVALASLALAGCQSDRMSSLGQPAPLPAAPAGTVTSTQLPPPAGPAGQFPAAPGSQMAAAPAMTEPPATAPDLTAGGVAGVWNATVSGQTCKVATPQTKFGAGFRAGPLRCPAPIDGVKSWNVSGKQLTLHNADGSVLARLYSSGPEKFDGQTESGLPISLTR
jgi:hypothetical protein